MARDVPAISRKAIGEQIIGMKRKVTNIYLVPTSLSAITFYFLMSRLGGLIAAYLVSKGEPFWTFRVSW